VTANELAARPDAKRGRWKSRRNVQLIATAASILERIHPASVRAVCYQLFNRRLIASMGKVDTNRVSAQLRDARELGVIPWDWIVDETREAERVSAWKNPAAYVDAVKRSYRRDRWTDQPDWIEVWSEKGTVRGTIAPVLDEYGITFRVMHGYGSATAVHDVARQTHEHGRALRVLYVGDWDPSGLHMSAIDLPGRLARYGGDVLIERVALTHAHVSAGNLPAFEAADKRNDTRYAWFLREHGRRCWELDALSPDVLRDEVEAAIVQHIDREAWDRATTAEAAECESLTTILNAWPGISRQARE
jgi:hypothetical protein